MITFVWGLVAIGIVSVVSRLIFGLLIGGVLGVADHAVSRSRTGLAWFFIVFLLATFLCIWSFLVLSFGVQLAEISHTPRWSFWLCAAVLVTLPIYLHAQKTASFGQTIGDGAIAYASIVYLIFYGLLIFTPLRAYWLDTFGLFEN